MLLGIESASTISRYERGELVPRLQVILGYQIVLGVPPQELFMEISEEVEEEILTRVSVLLGELEKQAPTRFIQHQISFLRTIVERL